ncbi:hypothetical protein PTKIN_Ptkin15bG0089700 [Pterospermum kingtungense]
MLQQAKGYSKLIEFSFLKENQSVSKIVHKQKEDCGVVLTLRQNPVHEVDFQSSMFWGIQQKWGNNWFGACILIRNTNGDTSVICRSIKVYNKIHAKALILREALLRLQEIGVTKIMSFDANRFWYKLIAGQLPSHWSYCPVIHDVIQLFNSLLQVVFIARSHPLTKEAKTLATAAAERCLS